MTQGRIIRASPWLYGLKVARVPVSLGADEKIDVAIVGGGIAGVATAYFLLTRTEQEVAIVERLRIANGASGNNAGTATPIFERSLSHFVEIFGTEKAKAGFEAVNDSWELLEEMHRFSEGMDLPVHVSGYFGYWHVEDVLPVLAENSLRVSLGLSPREIYFSEDKRSQLIGPIAEQPWIKFVPAHEIAMRLRTIDKRLVAAAVEHEALVDSAKLCDMTVQALLAKYPKRFRVYEDSPIDTINAHGSYSILEAKTGSLRAKKVVIATNGFEKFNIKDSEGSDINARFHQNVTSRLGYMLGIFFPGKEPEPASLAYIFKPEDEIGISFEYVTERKYELDGISGTLLSIGGPDSIFNHERAEYGRETPFRQGVLREMERFLEHHYDVPLHGKDHFLWHGLLGYTGSNARLVGPDPEVPGLIYNLGCNGVGILLSIWGGNRIAEAFLGEKLEPTMFDPSAHFIKP